MKFYKLVVILLVSVVSTGCMTMQTPSYEPSINNYEKLQVGEFKKVAIVDFTLADEELNQISVRGNPLVSSVNESYGTYLKAALEEEFYKAGLLQSDSSCVISGVILENDIETGASEAKGHITAQVVVTDHDKVLFDKTITATHQWASSFVGAVAIPRARDNYPFVVRDFISKLIEDEEFKLAMTIGK